MSIILHFNWCLRCSSWKLRLDAHHKCSEQETEESKGNTGERRKDPKVRRLELLGSGESSLAGCLLKEATEKLPEWLESSTAGDCVVELALGGEGNVSWTSLNSAILMPVQKCFLHTILFFLYLWHLSEKGFDARGKAVMCLSGFMVCESYFKSATFLTPDYVMQELFWRLMKQRLRTCGKQLWACWRNLRPKKVRPVYSVLLLTWNVFICCQDLQSMLWLQFARPLGLLKADHSMTVCPHQFTTSQREDYSVTLNACLLQVQ